MNLAALAALAVHAGIVGGIAIVVGVALRHDAALRLIAGLTAMFARSEARQKRAHDVLTVLRPGDQQSPRSAGPGGS